MATIKRFEDILSWQEARELNKTISAMIRLKKFGTNYSLINQIERSAGSIMDNIAEGFERGGNKEFIQFLFIARGSCGELRSQAYRALDDNYISKTEFDNIYIQCSKVNRLIYSLISYLKNSDKKGMKFN
jgi:four helix bundle protein